MMQLETLLQEQIPPAIRKRGEDYFHRGRTKVAGKLNDKIKVRVQGTNRYWVMLSKAPGELTAECTCPHYAAGNICKHVWAAVLAVDATRLLPLTAADQGMILLTPGPDGMDPDELEDESEPGDPINRPFPAHPGTASFIPGGYPTSDERQHGHKRSRKPSWKDLIQNASAAPDSDTPSYYRPRWPANRLIQYRIDVESVRQRGYLTLTAITRLLKLNGELGKPKSLRVTPEDLEVLPSDDDRRIFTLIQGATSPYGPAYGGYYSSMAWRLSPALQDILFPLLAASNRCALYWPSTDREIPFKLDVGAPPWVFHLEVTRDPKGARYTIRGCLRRGPERRELDSALLLLAGGWVFWETGASRLDDSGAFQWIATLRKEEAIHVPLRDANQLPAFLYSAPALPPIDLPEELRYQEITVLPKPRLAIKPGRIPGFSGQAPLWAVLHFEYGDIQIPHDPPGRLHGDAARRQLIHRDESAERQALDTLDTLGLKRSRYGNPDGPPPWEIPVRRLPAVVSDLMARGWAVEAEGRLYRRPGSFKFDVSSGIDWFELRGKLDFEGVSASLPALLHALKRKDNTVVLDDGSIGMLPEEWLQKYGAIAALGDAQDDHVRFQGYQAGLLDALLAAQPEATFDEGFRRIREQLTTFQNIQPVAAPSGFVGTLRDYQKDGLGWLNFLERFAFGGCLADDMGLGKTVQVLAFLEARRLQRGAGPLDAGAPRGPSLIAVPRSLIFNWMQEAARFTPKLRILDHAHATRDRMTPDFSGYDIVLITYGVLLRDIAVLKNMNFDYAILDEAQAIKNAEAQVSKAARLLQCRHRLALSGTPIQNHLGELWSLFEFLNPGMLGAASVFRLTSAAGREPSPETLNLLSRALRPFILRRTKSQVARELPERTEETIFCEMDRRQQHYYDELRDHYRKSLMSKVDRLGMNRSKIMILEALLRLRQAACHPGLISPKLAGDPSAKLDTLLPQLAEVMDEGHKVIVFSQFTSFLSILRDRLDRQDIVYEYLDGRTRNRAAPVERFQTDPDCRLFLISLKAGGLGLNLTEAEYVFLLDPWWNPAIEAQAIDRAHRIGQTRNVFAYRLIVRDTVEEKVLELQKTKRKLADSIISQDNSLIRTLTRDDLALLLG